MNKTKTIGSAEFEWPAFKNDKERIRFNSKKYKDCTISEAFGREYNIDLGNIYKEEDTLNQEPKEIKVGDILSVYIRKIAKNIIEFDSINLKETLYSTINLYKYDFFKKFLPTQLIQVKVTHIINKRIFVDPIGPMFDSWINSIIDNKSEQYNVMNPEKNTILVKDLKLTNGGFIGKVDVPTVSEFIGEPYSIEAFIPGSQIVLNIEDDFEKWNGKNVNAFVSNYIKKPGTKTNTMSLICSRKSYLLHKGNLNKIELFKKYCDAGPEWYEISQKELTGKVTGVINTSKKCGVFVEIPELMFTGMINEQPKNLVNYKPGQTLSVNIIGFEDLTYFDPATGQNIHNIPYVIEEGILKECHVKPIFTQARI